MESKKAKCIETASRMAVTRGFGGEGNGEMLVKETTDFQFEEEYVLGPSAQHGDWS